MSQVSRPFQIALVAMVLFVMVWFVALRSHGTSSEPTAASSTAQSSTYTGSAPGVAGLSKDIAKAHGAAKAAEGTDRDEASKSSKLTGEAAPSTTGSASSAAGAAHGSSSAGKASSPAGKAGSTTQSGTSTPQAGSTQSGSSTKTGSSSASKNASGTHGKPSTGAASKPQPNAHQAAIKHELAHGKVALLMFWNPKSSDDRSVRGQLHDLSRRDGRVAVHVALPGEVGDYGAYTQGIQILQTPTILVIDSKGQVTTLTGLNDARTIQQAVGDALRGGSGKAQVPTLTAWVHGSSRSAYIGKVNKLCKKPFSQGGDHFEGAARKQITSFKAFTNTLRTFMTRLRKIAPPAQDRTHIFNLISYFDAGSHDLDKALTAAVAGHAVSARQLVLEAQVQFDQSSTGLGEYGFTACFPEYAN